MADVVETTPENQDTVVGKTVEGTVSDDSNSKVTVETPVVENGVHNGDTPESTTAEAEVNNVAENESTEVKQENGIEENGEMAKVEDESEAPAEGGTEEPTEATTVQAEGNAEAVVEEPKEEVPPKVILHQFPPAPGIIPSLSPFCLKLETFLRIHKIPYENNYGYKMGKKGKLPWIEYKGEKKNDSNMIIDYLNQTFEVNLDKDFSNEQLALGRAARSMLEENTYWALVYNRYVDNFNEFKKLVTPASGGSLGFNVNQKMYQRKMQKCLDGHGLGRHSKEELYKIAEDDLKALSELLGEKEYLLGDNPSSFDCTVFGLCANILYTGMESPMSTYIKENAINLSALCDRIKETYWQQDWAEMAFNEKTEPTLKKGFSFRKKKSKTPKAKETPAEEAPADEAAAITTEETTPEEKPVENGEVPSPSSEVAPTEETSTETPSEEQPATSEEKEKTEVPTTETTETTSTEVTETEPDKEA